MDEYVCDHECKRGRDIGHSDLCKAQRTKSEYTPVVRTIKYSLFELLGYTTEYEDFSYTYERQSWPT